MSDREDNFWTIFFILLVVFVLMFSGIKCTISVDSKPVIIPPIEGNDSPKKVSFQTGQTPYNEG